VRRQLPKTYSRSISLALIAVIGVTVAACGDEAGIGGRPSHGMLGNASVKPECGAFNQTCLAQGLDAPLALNATTELSIASRLAGSSGPPLSLQSANAAVLQVAGPSVQAVGVGLAGLLFVGPKGQVLDFIHVWVAAAQELRIQRYSRSGLLLGRVHDTVTLLKGDELLISVEPYAAGQPLLGQFELKRSVDGDAVRVVPDAISAWYRIVALKAGQAKIELEALGLKQCWSIEVLP
jgi:hypothetical protein